MDRYRVVYLWRGERHEHSLRFTLRNHAEGFAASLQASGWLAWVEAIN